MKKNNTISPASLYIHFPFCVRKCRYCDFFSVPYENEKIGLFISLLKREREIVSELYGLKERGVRTVYCGGGTPSLLSPSRWNEFQEALSFGPNPASVLEWTVECNPDSFSAEKARAWLDSGVSRVVIGVQSLDNRVLRLIGRTHTAEKALEVLGSPVFKEFSSVGADIIHGLPGQTPESLRATLESALSFETVSHLSVYELTLSPVTPFGRHRRLLNLPPQETLVGMTGIIDEVTRKNGFERYEISNYARPGHECIHNQAYWSHKPYIGLGPSAHSYINGRRYSNVADLDLYVSILEEGGQPVDFLETIDTQKLAQEMIFLGLRTREGLNEDRFMEMTGTPFCNEQRADVLDYLLEKNKIEHTAGSWRLTEKGMLIADAVARRLI